MKRPDILNFTAGLSTDELDFTTWETNQTITVRARDILAVVDEPSGKEFPSDSGPVSRLYLQGGGSFLVRRSRTDILADIAAITSSPNLGSAYIQDQKLTGTDGGTATAGSFQTRDMNTITSDPQSLASVSANQIDLVLGSYEVLVSVPGMEVTGFITRLQNIDLGTTTVLGSTARSEGKHMTRSIIQGFFTIGVTTTFEVQMQVQATLATTGFGQAKGFAGNPEVYTTARFKRIA